MNAHAICFVNAGPLSAASSLRVVGDRIAAIDTLPARGDRVIDLRGERLLPGLINAHDHLQFNNFPRTRFRNAHQNVGEWIADITARKDADSTLVGAESLDTESRLLAGGLKNLLSGVTTVAHHDALHPLFDDAVFPVQVLRNYRWTHSLGLSGEREVVDSHRATPKTWVWIMHAGEGVDAAAAAEFDRLESLGVLDFRSLLVHSLAFDADRLARLAARGAAAVWCPSSNLFLFGRTLDPHALLAAGRLALGCDSRISGARDLLEEIRIARASSTLTDDALERLVTSDNARLLRVTDRGELAAGRRADLLVVPAQCRLADLERSQVRMVMVGGRMLYGDAALTEGLDARVDCVPVTVDGRDKLLGRRLTGRLAQSAWREPGLAIPETVWRAA
jgi:cytosine/adenosine deaminase-related metal-dependent hydrolase